MAIVHTIRYLIFFLYFDVNANVFSPRAMYRIIMILCAYGLNKNNIEQYHKTEKYLN